MTHEAKIELAWANLRQAEQNLNVCIKKSGCDRAQFKEMTDSVKEAVDEVLDQVSRFCPDDEQDEC
jgi:Fe-S cluster assembly iron-binding protein IscA